MGGRDNFALFDIPLMPRLEGTDKLYFRKESRYMVVPYGPCVSHKLLCDLKLIAYKSEDN